MDAKSEVTKHQDIQRLKFIATKRDAKNALADVEKKLNEIIKKPLINVSCNH